MDMEEELPDGDADGELHGDQLLVAEQVAAARPGGAIRMGEVIENHCPRRFRAAYLAACSDARPTQPQRAGPSGLNAHLPPVRRRIDSSDKDEPVRKVWPPRRAHLELKDGDYEQKSDAEPEPPRRRKKARRRTNPFIDAEANVDGDASNDEGTEDENDDLEEFNVADDVEF